MKLAPLTLLLSGVLGGCGDTAPHRPHDELVVALESAPSQLDPRLGTDQASERLFQLVYSGLFRRAPDGSLIPDLTTSVETLDGGTRLRFHLREDARFHDGRPVTAADVAWTFTSVLDPDHPSPKRSSLGPLRVVEAVDEHAVDFLLDEPFGPLLSNLTAGLGVVPAGWSPERITDNPVGSGPFKVVDVRPEQVTLEAHRDHHRGAPLLQRLVLREVPDATVRALELRKGSVQLAVNALPADTLPLFRLDPALRVVESPGANYAYLGFNLRDPVLADGRVRRAIGLAIDRSRLAHTLWRDSMVVTDTMMPVGHWARHPAPPSLPFDPAAARALLDQAGYPDPDGPGGEARLALSFKTSTNEPYVLQAQVIQHFLREVGIELEIRTQEFATFYDDVKTGRFQLYTLTWTGVNDPDLYRYVFHSENVPPRGANRGHYASRRIDRLLMLGARATDPEDRLPLYLEVQEILARDLPSLSLYHSVNAAVMPVGLTGYLNYPSGEFYGLDRVSWH